MLFKRKGTKNPSASRPSSIALIPLFLVVAATSFAAGYMKATFDIEQKPAGKEKRVVSESIGNTQSPTVSFPNISKTLLAMAETSSTETATSVTNDEEKNFLQIAKRLGTDKVAAHVSLPPCLKDNNACTRKGCVKEECRPWGHFYDTMYQKRMGSYSRKSTEPFQFLEIGFFNGRGFEAYMEFFPNAEAHSMEIACIEHGPRSEGKWPWDNFAAKNKWYNVLLEREKLHCGDASNLDFLFNIWTNKMNRTDAPPLKIVVDDGAHLAAHMVQTVFFWFPRIQPRGLLVVEDIMPITDANKFRTQFLPQIMSDLHFCGDPMLPDEPCFPTIQPLLASIHCEMHICVFERNDKPAVELSLEESRAPEGALDLKTCESLKS